MDLKITLKYKIRTLDIFPLNSILGIIGTLFAVPNKIMFLRCPKTQASNSLGWETASVYTWAKKQQSSLAYSRMNNSYPDGEDNRGLAGQQTNRHVPARTCLSLDKTEEILANACTTQTLPRVRSQPNTIAHTHIFPNASGRQKR